MWTNHAFLIACLYNSMQILYDVLPYILSDTGKYYKFEPNAYDCYDTKQDTAMNRELICDAKKATVLSGAA